MPFEGEVSFIESKIKALILSKELDTGIAETNDIDPEITDEETLHKIKLKEVIDQWGKERNDSAFSRTCLFCQKHFVSNRSVILTHMQEEHNFSIGAPDNLVYVGEFLDLLEEMLKELQCLFCEKIFKDLPTLKEHMRKKQHKKINPKNKAFDKFYMINYLEPNKSWEEMKEEEDSSDSENERELMECSDENLIVFCLFCQSHFLHCDMVIKHMKDEHNFDFHQLRKEHNLNVYKQIKLTNYIRKKVMDRECTICDESFQDYQDFLRHMHESGHISQMPLLSKFDQPSFFYCFYENDYLLCGFVEDDDDDGDDDMDASEENEAPVYPEDIPPVNTVLNDEKLRESLL